MHRVLSRLRGVKKSGEGYKAFCPAHEDKKPSLSVKHSDKKILVHCHAGCETCDIVEALDMTVADLFDEPAEKSIVVIDRSVWRPCRPLARRDLNGHVEYEYTDKAGSLAYKKIRREGKRFYREPRGVENILYNLPVLSETDGPVFYVEGEKDADNLSALGFIATTAGGVNEWRKNMAEHLRGRTVVIVPDNDGPGGKLAEKIAADLEGVAERVAILRLPELPEKGDVSDWLAAGGTANKLTELAVELFKAPPKEERIWLRFVDVIGDEPDDDEDEGDYLFSGLLPRGTPVIIGGTPKAGKSIATLDMAICLAAGRDFLGHFKCHAPARVLIIGREDPLKRARARAWWLMKGHGISPEEIDERISLNVAYPFTFNNQESVDEMKRTLDEHRPDLVLMDSFRRVFLGDENSSTEVAQMGAVWDGLCKEFETCIAQIHHLKKNILPDEPMLNQIRGSGDIVAIARQIIGISRVSGSDLRAIQSEGNYDAPGDPQTYELCETFDIANKRVWNLEHRGELERAEKGRAGRPAVTDEQLRARLIELDGGWWPNMTAWVRAAKGAHTAKLKVAAELLSEGVFTQDEGGVIRRQNH